MLVKLPSHWPLICFSFLPIWFFFLSNRKKLLKSTSKNLYIIKISVNPWNPSKQTNNKIQKMKRIYACWYGFLKKSAKMNCISMFHAYARFTHLLLDFLYVCLFFHNVIKMEPLCFSYLCVDRVFSLVCFLAHKSHSNRRIRIESLRIASMLWLFNALHKFIHHCWNVHTQF